MKGIIAAVPTPFDAQGGFIAGAFLEHARWGLLNGCDGLNILGSTGEANSLDSATRRVVMSHAAQGLDRSRLMVGTGTPSIRETIDLTCYADDLGYPVALVLPPYYYNPTEEGLIAWYLALDAALGDRPIRVWFYNFPQMTGFVIPQAVIVALHKAAPRRFDGIKDSSGDLAYCRSLVSRLPGLQVFPSSETTLAEGRQDGFAGCISATVNHTAPLCARVWKGETALAPQIADLRAAISGCPLIPAVKYLVARRTANPDWQNVLPPFTQLDPSATALLDRLVRYRIAA
ncbi:dihydrodipicolinate synthase family protein [Paracoccus sp. WLY502]|uniref:dihydrodipicolinate synthase family protein n=1 Tax=Paracoccus yibinensis TaxID=3068891 RepID=UPI002796772C|nr:dihydrodipicolinate synthase family protein [Paracoccus sp. WLY502]MDQ1899545.1 dihydrodipicolinate synthase family protein [Paracoccus sp. WLY502]